MLHKAKTYQFWSEQHTNIDSGSFDLDPNGDIELENTIDFHLEINNLHQLILNHNTKVPYNKTQLAD